MTKKLLFVVTILLVASFSLLAADVTGKWVAEQPGRNGGPPRQTTFTLKADGAKLTDVAIKAMEAGIPVINVDREFSSTFAARVTILGDNYGMGVSAGTFICEQFGDNPVEPVVGVPVRSTVSYSRQATSQRPTLWTPGR